MTWIKLNDNVPRHPKIAGLSHHGFRTWINSLCYASEFLTDGVLPVAFLVTVPRKLQDELISAGLWIAGQPVVIHDYLEHQTSKESVEKERQRNRERRTGERRETSGSTSGTTTGSTDGKPRPENREQRTDTENRSTNARETRSDDRFEAWWTAYPKKTGKGAAEKVWSKLRPAEATVAQMHKALSWQRTQPQWTKDGGSYVPNPATYLNQSRWEDEPFFTEPRDTRSLVPSAEDTRRMIEAREAMAGK